MPTTTSTSTPFWRTPSRMIAAAAIAEFNRLFAQGAIEGISYLFPSGNCGAADPATLCRLVSTSSTPQAPFPASSPWVSAVGGTSLEYPAARAHGSQLAEVTERDIYLGVTEAVISLIEATLRG